MQLLYRTYLRLQQESFLNTRDGSRRILVLDGLKPCNRFKATGRVTRPVAKAATGSTPRMNAGACAPLSGHD
jgi:hypothetical protein